MSFDWQRYHGKSPVIYAAKILSECGQKEPPICEKTVADYLQLRIKEYSSDDISAFVEAYPEKSDVAQHLQTACACLSGSTIWVNRETQRERKRLGVFHECGHDVMPWHDRVDYVCDNSDVDATTHKRLEREAFGCGSSFLMPLNQFIGDVMSVSTSFASIGQLSNRYVSSFEATAIWYVYTHPGYCALLMSETSPQVVTAAPKANPYQMKIRFSGRIAVAPLQPRSLLQVKYFVKSNRFPLFVRPGTAINDTNPIYMSWASGTHLEDEVQASAFGSSEKDVYRIECKPVGNTGRVMALLSAPDPQLRVGFANGVYP